MTYTLTIEQTAERIADRLYNRYDYYAENGYTPADIYESVVDILIDNNGDEMSIEEMHENITSIYL
jgi:hypothetical protein